jgi:hypothetical protein
MMADYLGVTVDMLLSRDTGSFKASNIQNSNVIHGAGAKISIGRDNAPGSAAVSEQTAEILRIFEEMTPVDRAKVLVYAADTLQASQDAKQAKTKKRAR